MDTNFNNVQYTFKQPYLEKIHIDSMHQNGDLLERFSHALWLCDQKQETAFVFSII